jgi:hypothetical protein
MGRTRGVRTRTTWLEDGRWTMWQCMRVLRTFTLPQLQAVTECGGHNVKRYVRCLEQVGYVRRVRERKRGAAGSHTVFALIEDTGPAAPRGQTDGKLYDPNLHCEVVPLAARPGQAEAPPDEVVNG